MQLSFLPIIPTCARLHIESVSSIAIISTRIPKKRKLTRREHVVPRLLLANLTDASGTLWIDKMPFFRIKRFRSHARTVGLRRQSVEGRSHPK